MELQVEAVELYGRVPGATASRLMRCSDGRYYVVKKPNSIHGKRSLANELLASLILERIGVSTPTPAIVHCSKAFLDKVGLRQPDPRFRRDAGTANEEEETNDCAWQAGLSFGSRVDAAGWSKIEDCPRTSRLPGHSLCEVKNICEFADILVFDAWCSNLDRRQAVFIRPKYFSGFLALMIDHGMCFGGRTWEIDAPSWRLNTVFTEDSVYENVYGMDAFEPIMTKIRSRCTPSALKEDASAIPPEWYERDRAALNSLLRRLAKRQSKLELLIHGLRRLTPCPFRKWTPDWKFHPQSAFLAESFVKVG